VRTGAGAFQGKLSLRKACRGCVSQMAVTRHQLNHALKLWKRIPGHHGDLLTMSDACPRWAGERHLREDAQGSGPGAVVRRGPTGQAHAAAYSGPGRPQFESQAMHADRSCCWPWEWPRCSRSLLGFLSAAKQKIDELETSRQPRYRAAGRPFRLGSRIAFAGMTSSPAWCAIDYLKPARAWTGGDLRIGPPVTTPPFL